MQRSLPDLIKQLRTGTLPLLAYFADLERHFREREPQVLAFVPEKGRFARLRRQAEALLRLNPDPARRPPLFGLPLGVKDIFHVDGFVTRAGSRLPPELFQGAESPLVTRLRELGALIFGKTVTTEFAYFAPGPTRNPHHPGHTPGGSSSGSAAAVGAWLVPLALGTQTIGSVNRPAAYCGVTGYKPTYNRLPKTGVLPLSASADTVGFFTPDVASLQHLLPLLTDWSAAGALHRPALGVPEGPYLAKTEASGLAHFEKAVARLAAAGFTIRRVPALPDFAVIDALHREMVAAEAAQVHAAWYAAQPSLYHAKTADLIETGRKVGHKRLSEALTSRSVLRSTLSALMDTHKIDLWLSPSAPGPAPRGLESTGNPVMNLPWTHAGLPTITLPAGLDGSGLPLGLQLAGRFGRDEDLLAWAGHVAEAL